MPETLWTDFVLFLFVFWGEEEEGVLFHLLSLIGWQIILILGSGGGGTGAGALTHLISPKEPLGSGEGGTGVGP